MVFTYSFHAPAWPEMWLQEREGSGQDCQGPLYQHFAFQTTQDRSAIPPVRKSLRRQHPAGNPVAQPSMLGMLCSLPAIPLPAQQIAHSFLHGSRLDAAAQRPCRQAVQQAQLSPQHWRPGRPRCLPSPPFYHPIPPQGGKAQPLLSSYQQQHPPLSSIQQPINPTKTHLLPTKPPRRRSRYSRGISWIMP